MGHLGQGNQITIVEDKEIVLTATNGQHSRMKVADLAEAVRQVMPVATSEKSGLMSVDDRGYLRYFNLFNIVGNINIGSVNGLIRFKIWSQTNEMSLYFISSRSNIVIFIGGKDIAEIGHAFFFNSSLELILEDKIGNGRINHILGLSENIV